MRFIVGLAAALLAIGCSSNPITGGPRPPQGPGPAGTQFGFWDRDADAAVDASFRNYITQTYHAGDEAKASATLKTDGFSCGPGVRPEGKPAPTLECERVYSFSDDVHAWTVQFWPTEPKPRARYSRTHIRDTTKNYDDRRS